MESHKFALAGKAALITGAGRRIGRALALALAGRGCDVVVHYRTSESEAGAVAESIRQLGRRGWTLAADLQSPEETRGLMQRAVEVTGGIDVLINSASIFPPSKWENVTLDDLTQNLQVNAYAPLVLAREMAAQGRPGRILNLLDSRVVDYDRLHVAYHLSKRALFTLTRMLAVELAPGITVNAVAPGLILPPGEQGNEYLEKWQHANLLGAWGSLEEVSDAALYLLESGFVTGQVLFVDGGRHMKHDTYGL